MGSLFFSFSVHLQFVRSHRFYFYWLLYRSSYFPTLSLFNLLGFPSLSPLFCALRLWIIFVKKKKNEQTCTETKNKKRRRISAAADHNGMETKMKMMMKKHTHTHSYTGFMVNSLMHSIQYIEMSLCCRPFLYSCTILNLMVDVVHIYNSQSEAKQKKLNE